MKNLEAEKLVAYLMATFPNWKPADVVADIWKNEFLPYDYEIAQPIIAAICRSEVHFMPPLGAFLSAINSECEARERFRATNKRSAELQIEAPLTAEEKIQVAEARVQIRALVDQLRTNERKF